MKASLPNPKTVINSKAFQIWCESVEEHLDNLENTMIRRIAEAQRREFTQPPIVQALAPIDFTSQLAEKWLFPMIDIKDFREKGLLFAPLSNTELDKLSGAKHTYRVDNKQFPVKLVRSKIFFPLERRLSCHFGNEEVAACAKFTYLPELSFPFLPYSRKFLELEFSGKLTSLEQKMIFENFSPESLVLQDGRTGKDVGIVNDLIPVWNVKSGNVTVGNRVSATPEGLYQWHPNANDSLYEGDTYIIHCAKDVANNKVNIWMSGKRLVSEFRFHRLEYSIIKGINNFPSILRLPVVGNEKINATDNFWYRNYLQTTMLTEKDIVQLIEMIPATKGRFKLIKVELNDLSEYEFKNLNEINGPFLDFLWYLYEDVGNQFSRKDMKTLLMFFKVTNEKDKFLDFIDEDIMCFFTSICKIHLPSNINCWGYLER
jgi:hypothetical protein